MARAPVSGNLGTPKNPKKQNSHHQTGIDAQQLPEGTVMSAQIGFEVKRYDNAHFPVWRTFLSPAFVITGSKRS